MHINIFSILVVFCCFGEGDEIFDKISQSLEKAYYKLKVSGYIDFPFHWDKHCWICLNFALFKFKVKGQL